MLRKLIAITVTAMLFGCDRPQEASMQSASDDKVAAIVTSQNGVHAQRDTWPLLDTHAGSTVPAMVGAVTTSNYYVVLDGSGSMMSRNCGGGSSKIDAALSAVKGFIAAAPANTNIGLAAFDSRAISERVALGIGNRESLYTALKDIQVGSDTPLLTSIKIGYEKLTAQARIQLGYGEYHLVIVTDGNPDPESEDPTPIINEILSQSPVVVHTVGFCINSNHVLNQPSRTYYASATNPQELQQGLQEVLAEAPNFDATVFEP